MKKNIAILFLFSFACVLAQQTETISKVWVADNGDGTYKNPILYSECLVSNFMGKAPLHINAGTCHFGDCKIQ